MYTVKVQRVDWRASGDDVALPLVVESVGSLERVEAAIAFAEMWKRYDNVAAVWIERDELLN